MVLPPNNADQKEWHLVFSDDTLKFTGTGTLSVHVGYGIIIDLNPVEFVECTRQGPSSQLLMLRRVP